METWILCHGDSDGICSAALALAANPGARVFFTNPVRLAEDLKRVESGVRAIVCDISLNENTLEEVLETMHRIASESTLLYTDHHPLPPNVNLTDIPGEVLHELGPCSSELAFRAFRNKLPRAMSRIAIYGAIGDYADNTPLIHELLKEWDKRTLFFEAGVLVQGLEGSGRDFEFKHKIVKLLSINRLPSSNSELVRRALVETHKEEKLLARIGPEIRRAGEVAFVLDIGAPAGKAATYARAIGGASVGIACETSKGIVDMSLRTERDDIDLNAILRDITPRLGGSGGGHPKASGAMVPEASFQAFIKALNASIVKKCPECGLQAKENDRFCTNCGSPLRR